MSNNIANLWPELPLTVVSPVVILKQQARYFDEQAGESMRCEVQTSYEQMHESNQVQHELIVRAPLIGYAHTLLTATHDRERPYPVTVESEALNDKTTDYTGCAVAGTEHEFINLIAKVLHSKETKTVLNAIAARLNSEK